MAGRKDAYKNYTVKVPEFQGWQHFPETLQKVEHLFLCRSTKKHKEHILKSKSLHNNKGLHLRNSTCLLCQIWCELSESLIFSTVELPWGSQRVNKRQVNITCKISSSPWLLDSWIRVTIPRQVFQRLQNKTSYVPWNTGCLIGVNYYPHLNNCLDPFFIAKKHVSLVIPGSQETTNSSCVYKTWGAAQVTPRATSQPKTHG